MPTVTITPIAERNLKAITLFIARDNRPRAYTFIDELTDLCFGLTSFPSRGSLFPTRNSNIRRLVHGNDLIFGGVGSDSLSGDGGTDALFGGDDMDELNGTGNDDHRLFE